MSTNHNQVESTDCLKYGNPKHDEKNMKTESGLVAFCYMSDQYEVALFSEPPTDPLYNDMFPVVRLSDAEAIIAKLRDALSETEAYHKRMVAAKDSEIERLSLYKNLAAEYGLSVFADLSKQFAALKLAREALWDTNIWFEDFVLARSKALAAIDEVLGE